jgi:hypothetical protein
MATMSFEKDSESPPDSPMDVSGMFISQGLLWEAMNMQLEEYMTDEDVDAMVEFAVEEVQQAEDEDPSSSHLQQDWGLLNENFLSFLERFKSAKKYRKEIVNFLTFHELQVSIVSVCITYKCAVKTLGGRGHAAHTQYSLTPTSSQPLTLHSTQPLRARS